MKFEKVKIRILDEQIKASSGIYLKGCIVPVMDSKKIRQLEKDGKIEYLNEDQIDLFEDK